MVGLSAMMHSEPVRPMQLRGQPCCCSVAFLFMSDGREWGMGCGAAPVFSAPAPKNTIRSGSGTVTISGLNFGAYSFTPTATHSGDILCGTASWTSGTTVACSPSAFTAQASATRARVTVSAVVGTRSVVGFTFDGTEFWATLCGGAERSRR